MTSSRDDPAMDSSNLIARERTPSSGRSVSRCTSVCVNVVLGKVPAGEALVGRVEEREEAVIVEEPAELAPLVRGGVDARWVVRAGVQHHRRPGGGLAQHAAHPVKI